MVSGSFLLEKNILSPSKLRKQWDRLVIEAKEEHEVKKNEQIRKHSGSHGRFAKRAMKNCQNQQKVERTYRQGTRGITTRI